MPLAYTPLDTCVNTILLYTLTISVYIAQIPLKNKVSHIYIIQASIGNKVSHIYIIQIPFENKVYLK